MKRKKSILSFCTVAAALTVIVFLKEKRHLPDHQRMKRPGKNDILLKEGMIKILPVVIYDES